MTFKAVLLSFSFLTLLGCSTPQSAFKPDPITSPKEEVTIDSREPAGSSVESGDLYQKSFVSVNKGDCLIENPLNFSPAIEKFKILIQSQALQAGQGGAFVYYNILGTTVGLLSPANYLMDKNSGQQIVTAKILLGLSEVADVMMNVRFGNLGKDAKSVGTIRISRNGHSNFTANFVCQ